MIHSREARQNRLSRFGKVRARFRLLPRLLQGGELCYVSDLTMVEL